ncbi:MAG: DUF3873 family protein [Oscillospiraceae bacterium]|nr:DUF3873 family protein [Oscillospiraceae bacterium]
MVVPKNLRNGEEQYEHTVKTYIRYYYRDMDGRLFITTKPTLDECKAEKDKWLRDNKRCSMSLKPDVAPKERAKRRQEFLEYYDNGALNDIIEGYVKIVFDDLGLTDYLDGYSFTRMFDEVGATEAWRRTVKKYNLLNVRRVWI